MTVVAWIINSLDREISEVVIDNDSALELWKELQEKYGEADSVRIAQLRAEISTCRQGNSTVTEYYNRLKNLWSEYVSFRPILACECGGVRHVGTCNTYAAVKNYQENDHVIDFIIGLNEEHENTKSQLLLMDPPPTLKVASKFAMKLERQIKGINKEVKTVDSVALAGSQSRDWNRENKPGSFNSGESSQGQGQGLFCRYCKKTNHNIEDCLRLKYKRQRERNAGGTGSYHRAANSAHCNEEPSLTQDNTPEHNNTLRLSSEDCNRLLALLQQNSNTASTSTNSPQANLTRTNINPVYPNYAGITCNTRPKPTRVHPWSNRFECYLRYII
ncbi:hypothetical protein LINPERPRIM_LOCUS9439 [Linum perenne]